MFRLAHLSDPHLGPMPPARLTELLGKRAIGYANWKRRRHMIHRRDVLAQLVADLHAQNPDHIAVTGDLVNLALEAEFKPALERAYQLAASERKPVLINVQGKKEFWDREKFPPGSLGKIEPGVMSYNH